MNHKIVTGLELKAQLGNAISTGSPVQLAVAFWGLGAADQLELSERTDAKIICNLVSGGTNPTEIQTLLARNIDVRQHDKIHAKIGVIGDKFSFVGSSNISANGLGFESNDANAWEECNVVFDHVDEGVEARFHSLWQSSSSITEEDLRLATIAWDTRHQAKLGVVLGKYTSIVDALRDAPGDLNAAQVYMVIYDSPAEEQVHKVDAGEAEVRNKYGDQFQVYMNWNKLSSNAYLVDFMRPSRGILGYKGIYRRHKDFPDFTLGSDRFHVGYEVKDILGITLSNSDIWTLREAATKYIRTHNADEDGAYYFPISQLRDLLI